MLPEPQSLGQGLKGTDLKLASPRGAQDDELLIAKDMLVVPLAPGMALLSLTAWLGRCIPGCLSHHRAHSKALSITCLRSAEMTAKVDQMCHRIQPPRDRAAAVGWRRGLPLGRLSKDRELEKMTPSWEPAVVGSWK